MNNTRGYNSETGEWNDSLTGDFLWSSVDTREAIPDVTTSSTWSLWRIYYEYETLGGFLDDDAQLLA